MKSKKFIAALCALAVVVSSSGGLPFGGLRLFDTAVTASAESYNKSDVRLSGEHRLSDVGVGTVISKNCTIYKNNGKGIIIYDVDGTTQLISKGTSGWQRFNAGFDIIILSKPSGNGTLTAKKCYICSLSSMPTAYEGLIYDGTEKTLINAEGITVTGGTLLYQLGENSSQAPTGEWTTTVPKGTNVGQYYVWYKVVANEDNYADYPPQCLTVSIIADISTATVNLAADNSVESIKVGDDTITDLSGFDITYGTDDSHTATVVPTDPGTYYAYVTPKDTNTAYTGTAKSAEFTVASTDPTYTITIPATVNLKSADPVEITAKDVTLNEGQKIVVTLDGASNTTSGSEFSAKDKSGESVVNYSIKAGDTDVAVGDTVAEFETKTGEQSAALTFTKDADSTPTFAGKHSEKLTFGVSVETTKTAAEKPNIVQADCTFSPSNGKSTLSNANITTAMEYSADNGTTWTDVTSDGSIASLAAGTVQIRVKETADKLASEAVSITVPEVLHINELVGPYYGDRLTCEYYAGETWQALVDRYDLIKAYSGHPAFGDDGFIYDEKGNWFLVTDLIDNTKTYEVQ